MRNPRNAGLKCAALALVIAAMTGSAAFATTLRIGIAEDPDQLDPAQSGTLGARYVFASMCDKLVDIDPTGKVVPDLAKSWDISNDQTSVTLHLRHDVTFQHGTKFNAAAVKFNIERDKTIPESKRKAELSSVKSVDVLDDYTVRLNLNATVARRCCRSCRIGPV